MESLKATSPNTIAVTNLVAIWSEVIARRASLWVGIQDSMTVMERRRVAIAAEPSRIKPAPARKRPAEPAQESSEAQDTFERMRRHSASKDRVRFTPDAGF